jgi:putative exporter of polyketide antibiotics
VFVVGSYFVDFLGGAASGSLADALRALSFFSYYDATTVMQTGLNWGSVALLLGVTAALVAGALWFFQRRDVGV